MSDPAAVPAEPRRPAAAAWWHCTVRSASGTLESLTVVESARYPDGERVELPRDVAAFQIDVRGICTAEFGPDERVESLAVASWYAPKAPPLWFVEVRQSTASPPAVALLAFMGGRVRPGTLLAQADWSNVQATTDEQLAAVRWYPATGEVDQLYVQPQWRRRTIAGALVAAMGTLSVARGWPRVWGDGQRTELGERLRNASSWHARAAELTHVAPPMTPNEAHGRRAESG